MPAAHFLGLRPRLVFAQYPDDLLLAEATPFHRPSPFSGDGLYLISAEFSGCRPGCPTDDDWLLCLNAPSLTHLNIESTRGRGDWIPMLSLFPNLEALTCTFNPI